jgi:hypothetical protein
MKKTIGRLFDRKTTKSKDHNSISQFQALCTALSATIGTGNIAGVAAAIAILLAAGLTRNPEPKDTFDDPYLAYAEVEKVFSKISGTVAYGADKIYESEATLDKYSYWK